MHYIQGHTKSKCEERDNNNIEKCNKQIDGQK